MMRGHGSATQGVYAAAAGAAAVLPCPLHPRPAGSMVVGSPDQVERVAGERCSASAAARGRVRWCSSTWWQPWRPRRPPAEFHAPGKPDEPAGSLVILESTRVDAQGPAQACFIEPDSMRQTKGGVGVFQDVRYVLKRNATLLEPKPDCATKQAGDTVQVGGAGRALCSVGRCRQPPLLRAGTWAHLCICRRRFRPLPLRPPHCVTCRNATWLSSSLGLAATTPLRRPSRERQAWGLAAAARLGSPTRERQQGAGRRWHAAMQHGAGQQQQPATARAPFFLFHQSPSFKISPLGRLSWVMQPARPDRTTVLGGAAGWRQVAGGGALLGRGRPAPRHPLRLHIALSYSTTCSASPTDRQNERGQKGLRVAGGGRSVGASTCTRLWQGGGQRQGPGAQHRAQAAP